MVNSTEMGCVVATPGTCHSELRKCDRGGPCGACNIGPPHQYLWRSYWRERWNQSVKNWRSMVVFRCLQCVCNLDLVHIVPTARLNRSVHLGSNRPTPLFLNRPWRRRLHKTTSKALKSSISEEFMLHKSCHLSRNFPKRIVAVSRKSALIDMPHAQPHRFGDWQRTQAGTPTRIMQIIFTRTIGVRPSVNVPLLTKMISYLWST